MSQLPLFVCLVILCSSISGLKHSGRLINYINYHQKLWRAGRNFNNHMSDDCTKKMMGTVINEEEDEDVLDEPQFRIGDSKCTSHPDHFDARIFWPYCDSIRKIRDQGGCGSCWAIGVASVMTDRICTLTNLAEQTHFSEEDILTCCSDCLIGKTSVCDAGSVNQAWLFAQDVGVVSGGTFGTSGGCKSYEIKPCGRMVRGKMPACATVIKRPYCNESCTSNVDIDYNADKKRFSKVYHVNYDPMCEIKTHGPIVASMNVYTDFVYYKSGIYRQLDMVDGNDFIGNHTVKIIGWGVDNTTQTKYWIAANSWGKNFGESGFFKIVRGENHCNIEKYMTAGIL